MKTATAAWPPATARTADPKPRLDQRPGPVMIIVFIGLLFTGCSLVADVTEAGGRTDCVRTRSLKPDLLAAPPLWVKVAVALALGIGTMVGWKRIAVTVGEKIGKTQLVPLSGSLYWRFVHLF